MIEEIWLGISGIFMLLGAVGLLRFKCFYLRAHSATMTTVGGVCLSLFYFAYKTLWSIFSFKTLLIIIFLLLTSPTATHAISHAAFVNGIKPKSLVKNEMEGEK